MSDGTLTIKSETEQLAAAKQADTIRSLRAEVNRLAILSESRGRVIERLQAENDLAGKTCQELRETIRKQDATINRLGSWIDEAEATS